jgi:type II secretory pathway predicted ATPase ExeA
MSGMAEEPADPFGLASTPSAYVPRAASERALHELDRALRDRRVPALLGPPGLGKTLLLQRIAARVGHRARAIYIPYSPLPISELCALALGLAERPPSPDPVAALLNHARELRLQRSGLLLLIDDAGALPVETAEALVGLVEASRGALSVALAAVDTEESARVCAAFGDLLATIPLTEGMSEEETLDYVERRLAIAGAPAELRAAFDEDTVMDLHAASEGVPRRLNVAAQSIVRSLLPEGPRMPGLPELKDETPIGVDDATVEPTAAELVSSGDEPSMEPLDHAPYAMEESIGPETGFDVESEPDSGFSLEPELDEESEVAEGPYFDEESEIEPESEFEQTQEFEQAEQFDPEFDHEPEFDPEEEFDPGPEFEEDLETEPDHGSEPDLETEPDLDREPPIADGREPVDSGASPYQEALAMLREFHGVRIEAYTDRDGDPEADAPSAAAFFGQMFHEATPAAEDLAALGARKGVRTTQEGDGYHVVDGHLVSSGDEESTPGPAVQATSTEPVVPAAPRAAPSDAREMKSPTPETKMATPSQTALEPISAPVVPPPVISESEPLSDSDDDAEVKRGHALRSTGAAVAARFVQLLDAVSRRPVAAASTWLAAVVLGLIYGWATVPERPAMPPPPSRVLGEDGIERFKVGINAFPWALIEVDGVEIGETPIAGLALAEGAHTFRAYMPNGKVREKVVIIDSVNRSVAFD